MLIDDLMREADRLVKPSLILVNDPSTHPPIGWWRAPVKAESALGHPQDHLVSIACDWLASKGYPVSGALSVFVSQSDDAPDVYEVTPNLDTTPASLDLYSGGTPLWGVEAPSYPPLVGLATYGNPELIHHLRTFTREEQLHVANQYNSFLWTKIHATTGSRAAAIVGGWAEPWEDEQYDENSRLLLSTLWEAEPWYEVWLDGDELTGEARIT